MKYFTGVEKQMENQLIKKDKSDFYKSQGEKSSTTKKSNKSKSRSRSRVSRRRTR